MDKFWLWLGAAGCLLWPAQGAWALSGGDFARSEVRFLVRAMKIPIDGRFKRVSGRLELDFEHLAASRVEVQIDLASLDIGLPGTEAELKKGEWFAVERFPVASFVASDIRRVGPRQYRAVGEFTLKGVTRTLALPFERVHEPGGEALDGSISIRRLDFGIGAAEWADLRLIGNEVQVHFKLPLTSPDFSRAAGRQPRG